uniref:Uncharacterized protein n=1 Tax=Rhizophora mucronata TaxID=61149 RepID=A0A2P2PGQ0_RHIMU
MGQKNTESLQTSQSNTKNIAFLQSR